MLMQMIHFPWHAKMPNEIHQYQRPDLYTKDKKKKPNTSTLIRQVLNVGILTFSILLQVVVVQSKVGFLNNNRIVNGGLYE